MPRKGSRREPSRCPSRRKTRQRPPYLTLPQTLERAVAELADPLASDAEHPTDLLQGMLPTPIQPKVESQHLGIAGCQRAECDLDLFLEEALHGALFRIALLLGNEALDERAFAFRIERG